MNFIATMTDAEQEALAEEMAQNFERMWKASKKEILHTLTECGMPRRDAENMFKAGAQIEAYARQFHCDYLDSKMGHPKAKERVEKCREMWGRLSKRREEQR